MNILALTTGQISEADGETLYGLSLNGETGDVKTMQGAMREIGDRKHPNHANPLGKFIEDSNPDVIISEGVVNNVSRIFTTSEIFAEQLSFPGKLLVAAYEAVDPDYNSESAIAEKVKDPDGTRAYVFEYHWQVRHALNFAQDQDWSLTQIPNIASPLGDLSMYGDMHQWLFCLCLAFRERWTNSRDECEIRLNAGQAALDEAIAEHQEKVAAEADRVSTQQTNIQSIFA